MKNYPDTKECAKCKQVSPITEFAIVKRKKTEYRRSYCKACLSLANKEMYAKRFKVGIHTEEALAKQDKRIQERPFFPHLAPLPAWAQPGPQT